MTPTEPANDLLIINKINNQHIILSESLHTFIFNFKCPGRNFNFNSKTWTSKVYCTTSPIRPDNAPLTQFRDVHMYGHISMDTATWFVFNTHKHLPYFFFFLKANYLFPPFPSFLFLSLLSSWGRQCGTRKHFPL